MSEPIPAPVREVLALFEGDLGEVQFPEVDLQILQAQAESVADRAGRVGTLQRQLEEARTELEASQATLLAVAIRGIAYARVYAAQDEALLAQVEALTLARAPSTKRRKRRAPRAPAPVEDTPLPLALAG